MPYNACILPLLNALVLFRVSWICRFSKWKQWCLDVQGTDVSLPFRFLTFGPFATFLDFHLQKKTSLSFSIVILSQKPGNSLALEEKTEEAEVIDSYIKSHCNVCTFWSNHISSDNVSWNLKSKCLKSPYTKVIFARLFVMVKLWKKPEYLKIWVYIW